MAGRRGARHLGEGAVIVTDKKPEKKPLTADEKIALLVKLAAANGWSIPKELR